MHNDRRRRAAEWVALVAASIAAALWSTWPLALRLGEALPGEDRDPLLNAWILAWSADRARHAFHGLWDAPILYPYKHTFAFSEHLLGLAPVSIPLEWATRNPIAAYNVLFLGSYVLAAVGMYLLVRELTARRDAALVAAAAFAFCPYRVAQVTRLQIEMCGWIPIVMWGLHRFVRTHRRRDLAIAVAAFMLQGLTNGYYLYYALLPIAVVGAAAWRRGDLRTGAAVRGALVSGVVLLLVFGPLAYVYLDVRRLYDLRRDVADNARFSADVGSYLHVTPSIRARFAPARWLPDFTKPDGPLETKEGELFPGLVPMALAIAAPLVFRRRRTGEPADRPTTAATIGALWRRDIPMAAAAFAVVSVAAGWNDAGVSFALWVLLVRSVCPLPRSNVGLYGVIAMWAAVLSLGPAPTAWGREFFPGSPYALLFHFVPGLDGLRVPARVGVITSFALAVVAGLVFAQIRRPAARIAGAAAAIALVLADVAVAIPLVEIGPRGRLPADPVYRWLKYQPPGAVLELPIARMDYNYSGFRYEYATLVHRHPLVNGWTGYTTVLQQFLGIGASPLRDRARFRDALAMLDGLGVRYVIVHPGDFEEPPLVAALLEGLRAAPEIVAESARAGDVVAFRLLPRGDVPAGNGSPSGDPDPVAEQTQALERVRPAAATAEPYGDAAAKAFDDDLETRWTSAAPQHGGEWIELSLAHAMPVAGVEFTVHSRSIADYPRELRIDAAGNTVFQGSVLRALGEGFRRDAARVRITLTWPAATTDRLRLEQSGENATQAWSIDEVRLLTATNSLSKP